MEKSEVTRQAYSDTSWISFEVSGTWRLPDLEVSFGPLHLIALIDLLSVNMPERF